MNSETLVITKTYPYIVRRFCFQFITIIFLTINNGCDLLTYSRSIYVVNKSSSEEVILNSIAVDDVKLNYQDVKIPKRRYWIKPAEYKAISRLHKLDIWIRKKDFVEKYSCNVKSISNNCTIVVNYLGDGIECGVCFVEESGY